jgi:mono/diheme cytochrome c family protein
MRRGWCVVPALLGAGCEIGVTLEGILRTPVPALERMVVQRKFKAYGENPLFADGRAMRPPPDGTVARGAILDPALLRGRIDGSELERSPVPVSYELLRRGRDRFDIFCAACHGVLGDGQSAVAEKMTSVRPRDLHLPRMRALSVGRLYRVVSEGYGLMPSYAAELEVEDRWAVVAYVRALQLSRNATVAELPEPIRSEAEQALR